MPHGPANRAPGADCPSCGYDLSGLSPVAVCPECGLRDPLAPEPFHRAIQRMLASNRRFILRLYAAICAALLLIVFVASSFDFIAAVILTPIIAVPFVIPLWFSLVLNTISSSRRGATLLAGVVCTPYLIAVLLALPGAVPLHSFALLIVLGRVMWGTLWIGVASIVISRVLSRWLRTEHVSDD